MPDAFEIVLYLVPMILSITVHEYAHARVAYALGDDTASLHGRMTLNPLAHIDIFGTLIIPLVGIMSGAPFFGWAKPVPISPLRFTRRLRMKTGILITAVAGPLSNILFAAVLVAILYVIKRTMGSTGANIYLRNLVFAGIVVNFGLAVFNLIPIPPLDGSKVLMGILPDRYFGVMEYLNKYSFVLFIILIIAGGRFLAYPVFKLLQLVNSII